MLNMTSQRWLTDDDFSIDSDAKRYWRCLHRYDYTKMTINVLQR